MESPRTPRRKIPPPLDFNLTRSPNVPITLNQSQSVGGSLGTPGKSMKEYDESFKEMKKENFNLKLRIFFLEERLGLGKKTNADELLASNMDLKVQLSGVKQELSEKAGLMAEASQALEQMEQQMQEQELRHQQQIRRMEESMDSMGHSSQMLLNAQASSKQDQLFFQPDKDDFLNNNEAINKRVGLEALEEVEEVSDVENKCEQHLKRIQELEVSNASSQASLNEVREKLAKAEKKMENLSNLLESKDCEIRGLTSVIADQQEDKNRVLKEELQAVPQKELVGWEENKKIKDQLKLQIQERKLLLKKISMLKEQLGTVSEERSDTECKKAKDEKDAMNKIENSEHGVQCDLGFSQADPGSEVSLYKEMIVNLNKKLANATTACDTLREQLEEILDTAENGDADHIKSVLEKGRSVSRNISDDLNRGITPEPDMNGSFIEEEVDNPLSDASTWNMELPTLSEMKLCSSPELQFDMQGHRFGEDTSKDVCNNVIEHLTEQIEKSNAELVQKCDYITSIEDELAQKNEVIKEQSETINEYREDIIKLEENMYGPKFCFVLDEKHKEQEKRSRRRGRRKRTNRSIGDTLQAEAQAVSDSDWWSAPEPGVSLARIGLPRQFPQHSSCCTCETTHLLSDSGENTTSGPPACLSGCLSAGHNAIRIQLDKMIGQLQQYTTTDSGVETDFPYKQKINLCSNCSGCVPQEFHDLLSTVQFGLNIAVLEVEKITAKLEETLQKIQAMEENEKDVLAKEEDAKSRLNENYILIAKLSSENLRLLGEFSKLENTIEDLKESNQSSKLKLQDEICLLNQNLISKENELERVQVKLKESESISMDLKDKIDQFQNLSRRKDSPDTSSSFDFFPFSGASLVSTTASSESFRPRSFSACAQGPPSSHRRAKLADISSPDLGVGMESDTFSSLERGKNHRVGSSAVGQLVQENRALKHDRQVLVEKLGRSKSALQETLLRLSQANLAKQGQVAPETSRRQITQEGGNQVERKAVERPKKYASSKSKSSL